MERTAWAGASFAMLRRARREGPGSGADVANRMATPRNVAGTPRQRPGIDRPLDGRRHRRQQHQRASPRHDGRPHAEHRSHRQRGVPLHRRLRATAPHGRRPAHGESKGPGLAGDREPAPGPVRAAPLRVADVPAAACRRDVDDGARAGVGEGLRRIAEGVPTESAIEPDHRRGGQPMRTQAARYQRPDCVRRRTGAATSPWPCTSAFGDAVDRDLRALEEEQRRDRG